MTAGGGAPQPARGLPHDGPRAGHIPCCICLDTIRIEEYRTARCWTDPHGTTCAAHAACLRRIGEHELRLPPDPGEPTR